MPYGRSQHEQAEVRFHERLDGWVRWVLFHYVFGCIIGTHLNFVLEVVHPLPFGATGKVLFTVVFVPLGIILAGLAARAGGRPRTRVPAGDS